MHLSARVFNQHTQVFLKLRGELFNHVFGFCFLSVGSLFLRNKAGFLFSMVTTWQDSYLYFIVSIFCFSNVSAKLLILFSLVLFCFFTLFGACEILVFLQCFIISPRSLFISTCCLYIYSGCLSQHVFSWIFTSCFIEVIPSSILWTIIFKQYLAFPILRRFLKS